MASIQHMPAEHRVTRLLFQAEGGARDGEGREEGEDCPNIHTSRQRELCQENTGDLLGICIYDFLVTCLNVHFSSPSFGMMGAMTLSLVMSVI